MKENIERHLVLAVIISISIIIYSFFIQMLLWGIIAAVLIMILTLLLSGFINSQMKTVSLIKKVKGFLIEPSKTYDASKEDTLVDATKYFVILVIIFAILKIISSGVFFSLGLKEALRVGIFILIPHIVMIFIYGAILHIGVYIVGGKNDIYQTIKVLMYAYTPTSLFAVIVSIFLNGIFVFLLWLWGLLLIILGIRQLQEITTNRALIAVFIWIVVLSLLLILIMGPDFIPYISGYVNKTIAEYF